MCPCSCNRCSVGKDWDKTQCWICWLNANVPSYTTLWKVSNASAPPRPKDGYEVPFKQPNIILPGWTDVNQTSQNKPCCYQQGESVEYKPVK